MRGGVRWEWGGGGGLKNTLICLHTTSTLSPPSPPSLRSPPAPPLPRTYCHFKLGSVLRLLFMVPSIPAVAASTGCTVLSLSPTP